MADFKPNCPINNAASVKTGAASFLQIMCKVLMVGSAMVLLLWFTAFMLLFFLFLPVFFVIDWARTGRRQNPARLLRFMWINRPRLGVQTSSRPPDC